MRDIGDKKDFSSDLRKASEWGDEDAAMRVRNDCWYLVKSRLLKFDVSNVWGNILRMEYLDVVGNKPKKPQNQNLLE